MKVLIVDDSKATRTILGRMMSAAGFEVIEASNGAEGLGLMHLHEFAVCLVDWNMPVMNGVEFIRAVRTDNAFADLPLILVSDEDSSKKIDDAMSAGADLYLEKPFQQAELAHELSGLGFPTTGD